MSQYGKLDYWEERYIRYILQKSSSKRSWALWLVLTLCFRQGYYSIVCYAWPKDIDTWGRKLS